MKVLAVLLVLLALASDVSADISRVRNREGKTVAYIESDSSGTTRIRDREWRTTGYIDDSGAIYDRQWSKKGSIDRD